MFVALRCMTSPWCCCLVFSGMLTVVSASCCNHPVCVLPPPNPTCLNTLLWPCLVQGFCLLPSPWSLCHSQLLPPGSICYFNSSSQPSYPVSAPRCTYQNRRFQLFPLRGWEAKATLGMPSWSGDFSVPLYQGISTCGMEISHRRPVKRALKHPGSCDTAWPSSNAGDKHRDRHCQRQRGCGTP